MMCLIPDGVTGGAAIEGPVVVYDDDHYFMASVLAEKLRHQGMEVTYVTPVPEAATWMHNILEQRRIQGRLLGVVLALSTSIDAVNDGEVEVSCVYTGRSRRIPCATVVLVTMREPLDAIHQELVGDDAAIPAAGIRSITRIGDCLAPGLIAAAVHSGHRYARELDAAPVSPDVTPFRREVVQPVAADAADGE